MDEEEKRPLFSVNADSSDDEPHSRTYSTNSSDSRGTSPSSSRIHHHSHSGNNHGHSHGHSHGHGHSHSHSHSHGDDEEHLGNEIVFCPSGITGREKKRQSSNAARITLMGVLMLLYSIGEIVFSLKAKSLTMFSDGLHNLSDALALAVALWAERVQHKDSQAWMTFGWKRAETIGGFVNAGFVLSMAVFVVLQAVPDFIYEDPDKIPHDEALNFVIVAAVGIFLNIIGMVAFCGHGHSHGGHGHSHGGGGGGHGHSHGGDGHKKDHNIWALFLHFLGDVLTSMLVLAVGLLVEYYPVRDSDGNSQNHWVAYLDPSAAVLSCVIIFATTWPVVTSTCRIFLQFSPPDLDIQGIKRRIQTVDHVLEIHEAHFWQLVDSLVICTMHLKVAAGANWNQIRRDVQTILHSYGIHNTTLQPEFIDQQDGEPMAVGLCDSRSNCVPECSADRCCT